MKKFLFLLIILGCAVYWGMSQGDDLSRQAKASHGGAVSAQPVKPAKEEKGVIAEVKDTVATLISGMSSSPTAQGAVEKQAKPSPSFDGGEGKDGGRYAPGEMERCVPFQGVSGVQGASGEVCAL